MKSQVTDWTLFRIPGRLTAMSTLAISALVFIAYSPGLEMNFIFDDWKNLETLGRLGAQEFIRRSFDPLEPSFLTTFRPLQGLLLGMEYLIFNTSPFGYHCVHIVMHLINSILVLMAINQVAANHRLALLAGLFYATLPVYNLSVFLPSAPDVLAALFYLFAVLFWTIYLRAKKRWAFGLTHLVFVLGLLSKEIVVTLPFVLLLIDCLLIRNTSRATLLLRHYFLMAAIWLIYVIFEIRIQPGTFLSQAYGLGIGNHILFNMARYVAQLIFPWQTELSDQWWLIWTLAPFLVLVVARTNMPLLILSSSWAILNVLPVVMLSEKFSPRFLYLSGVGSALLLALAVEAGWSLLKQQTFFSVVILSMVSLLLLLGAQNVQNASKEINDSMRAQRAAFREISLRHETLSNSTLIYFITPPANIREISGMLYVRYGGGIQTRWLGDGQRLNAQTYQSVLIYDSNQDNSLIEVAVNKSAITNVLLSPSLTFARLIQLEGYELLGNSISAGQRVALVLYWRALERINEDYTVFVHLVCDGEQVVGEDNQPARGRSPTTSWNPNFTIVDVFILSVPPNIATKDQCNIHVGLYELATLQRLPVMNEHGAFISDHIEIESLSIQK